MLLTASCHPHYYRIHISADAKNLKLLRARDSGSMTAPPPFANHPHTETHENPAGVSSGLGRALSRSAGTESLNADANGYDSGNEPHPPTITLQRLRRSHYARQANLAGSIKDQHRYRDQPPRRWRTTPSLPAVLGLGFALLLLLTVIAVRQLLPSAAPDTSTFATSPISQTPTSPSRTGVGAGRVGEDATPGADITSPASSAPGTGTPNSITIYISGAVARPGVVTIENGARLHQAIEKVGGLTSAADMRGVNLAAKLTDAQHIHVPAHGESLSVGSADNGGVEQRRCVDVLTATAADLERLNGVGPALAARIVQARQDGSLTRPEQLREVSGIGPKKYAQLESQICR